MLAPVLSRAARRKALPRLSCSLSASPSSHIRGSIPPRISHQRRHSSSKPSSSSNGDSRHASAPTDAPVKEAAPSEATDSVPSSRKRTFSKMGRTKAKEGSTKVAPSAPVSQAYAVPSVPSTQHLHRQVDVHIASLFAFHRPISVSTPLPTPTTNKHFSSIFSSRAVPKQPPSQVMFTLNSTIQNLEKGIQTADQQQQQQQPQQPQLSPAEQDLRAAVTQASQSNAEPPSTEVQQTIYINLEEMAKNFRPFHPPPPPVPINGTNFNTIKTAEVIPVRQLDLPAAVVEEIAENIVPGSMPRQPFLNRLWQRFLKREEAVKERRKEIYKAISVKRQRRLKMKKHKYKKLMKKTRNLRQRQGRL